MSSNIQKEMYPWKSGKMVRLTWRVNLPVAEMQECSVRPKGPMVATQLFLDWGCGKPRQRLFSIKVRPSDGPVWSKEVEDKPVLQCFGI